MSCLRYGDVFIFLSRYQCFQSWIRVRVAEKTEVMCDDGGLCDMSPGWEKVAEDIVFSYYF